MAVRSQTVDPQRVRALVRRDWGSGPIVYWMSRDQRVHDNWALLYSQQLARERRQGLIVVFCLQSEFLGATLRQYEFMLKGLEQVEAELRRRNIPLRLLFGDPERVLREFIAANQAGALVTDFTALRIQRTWKEKIAREISIPFLEVDAHNVVPCWVASSKQEFAAYTIRPKIHKLLPQFLTEFPVLQRHPYGSANDHLRIDWGAVRGLLKVDRNVGEVAGVSPGELAAQNRLTEFVQGGLSRYYAERNLPTHDAQSNLSPYLHFGQISAQRVALEVQRPFLDIAAQEAFLEELIVRRELSDNYCHNCTHYDSFDGFPEWAQESLNEHRGDLRTHIYSRAELEHAQTHDDLWNAAQLEMVTTGKMHGYLRMYWAKKILEWTHAPERAQEIAIYLNDRYELDGRDPNGYTGIAWSIGGVHDRAWGERAVFGKVRYMSYDGCARKFDVKQYIGRFAEQQKLL